MPRSPARKDAGRHGCSWKPHPSHAPTYSGIGWSRVGALLALLALLGWTFSCVGADPAAESPPATKAAPPAEQLDEPALVEVFNRPVVVLRATGYGYTPAKRVKGINARIAALLDKKIYGPVASEPRADGILITIGGEPAFTIGPGDVDPVANMSLETTAQEVLPLLTAALQEAKLQRSTGYLFMAVAKAAGSTLVFVALCIVLVRGRRLLLPRLRRLEKQLAHRLSARGLMYLARLVQGLRWMVQLVFWVLLLGFTSEWASIGLRFFPYTRPWGEGLQEHLRKALLGILHALAEALPDLLVIVVIVALARGAVGVLKGVFRGIETGEVKNDLMDVEAAKATRRILTIIVWLIAVVMIFPYIPGSGSNAFRGMSVFIGLLLSLGSSSVVGQFTSGLVLMYSRALKPGEYVLIGEHEGTVESLGFLSTKIRSPRNEEFHVPNLVILGTTVRNYSRLADRQGLLLHTTVTIGYDAPWRQVHALLIAAAKRTTGLRLEPAPFVLQTALSDFYVEYQLNACLANPPDRIFVLAALHEQIQDQFNAAGVQIMSPHYLQDKAKPVLVPKEQWYAPPAAPEPPSARPP